MTGNVQNTVCIKEDTDFPDFLTHGDWLWKYQEVTGNYEKQRPTAVIQKQADMESDKTTLI